MSNQETIEALCGLLIDALNIVREQAALLAMHEIQTDSGLLEAEREALEAKAAGLEEGRK